MQELTYGDIPFQIFESHDLMELLSRWEGEDKQGRKFSNGKIFK